MGTKSFIVDLSKPLVSQVGYLGEAYDEWVHQPIISKEGPRFFGNDLMESLTRTVWWVVPMIWLPVVSLVVFISMQRGLTPTQAASSLFAGVIAWTLLEYSLHRFFFHTKTSSYWGNTFHYLIHGCHHKHPMDALRLVFPPAGTTIVSLLLWSLIKCFAPPSLVPALYGGILLGYVMYDITHYYLHHGKPSKGLAHDLKRYHMNHHYKIQNKGFGITSPLWDRAFGTYPSTKAAQE